MFLTILTSGLHYVVQRLNYRRDLARIERILKQAKLAAWGPKMMPAGTRKKVRLLCHFLEICPVHQVPRSGSI
jgi:DnaJ homolog subfamily C member 1